MSVPSKLTAPVSGKHHNQKRRSSSSGAQHERPRRAMAADFVAGCVGGVTGVVVGHPLDTVKVHMQMRGSRYSSTLACARSLVAQHSLRGLYRGVTSPMGGVAFVNAVVFGVYGGVQRRSPDPDSPLAQAAAGAAAGLAQAAVCSPVELAKTRLQLGLTEAGPLRCLADVARAEGPAAVFRGLGLTAARDTPAFAVYFLCFELLSRREDGRPAGALRTLGAGGAAGMASWAVSYPVDVIKSRVQADGAGGVRAYSGALDCLRKGIAAEGRGFLWRGIGSVMLRAFPTNAACFGAVTACLRLAEASPAEAPREVQAGAGAGAGAEAPRVSRWTVHCGAECAAQAYRSLLFAGAFSEAVCAGDIRDLHEDFAAASSRSAPGALHIGLPNAG